MSLINYVTKIHFAEHVLEDALEAELELNAVGRPLVVCDHAREEPALVDRLLSAIPRRCTPAVFRVSGSDANEDDCASAAACYLDNACDAIIGFGNGAIIDLAKAVALEVSHEGVLQQYSGLATGAARLRNALPPVIAIPTAAGTGTEVAGTAVIVMRSGAVTTLASPLLVPRVAICDPTLTLGISAAQTACDGMDALTHCIETFIATAYNPPADGISFDGLRRVASHIERAVADGSDIEARREMMAAALNGGLAQQKGLGAVHAMSNALRGTKGLVIGHGTINAVLLPAALAFNAPAVAHRYDDIKRGMNVPQRCDLGEAIAALRERIGLPGDLSAAGLDETAITQASVCAARDYANRSNPRRASPDDYRAMLIGVA
ncbi:MAG TPA: iron-containing alcohol dehydrogenase [Saliniramus sp.]|nr:iron-containing alcohol dehydrogenase [Saliniramus sp.]